MTNAELVTYLEIDAKKKFNLVQTFSLTSLSLRAALFVPNKYLFATICLSASSSNIFLKLSERWRKMNQSHQDQSWAPKKKKM